MLMVKVEKTDDGDGAKESASTGEEYARRKTHVGLKSPSPGRPAPPVTSSSTLAPRAAAIKAETLCARSSRRPADLRSGKDRECRGSARTRRGWVGVGEGKRVTGTIRLGWVVWGVRLVWVSSGRRGGGAGEQKWSRMVWCV